MTPGLKKFWKGPNTTSNHQKFDRKIIKWFLVGVPVYKYIYFISKNWILSYLNTKNCVNYRILLESDLQSAPNLVKTINDIDACRHGVNFGILRCHYFSFVMLILYFYVLCQYKFWLVMMSFVYNRFNPFHVNVPFLHPWKRKWDIGVRQVNQKSTSSKKLLYIFINWKNFPKFGMVMPNECFVKSKNFSRAQLLSLPLGA